MAYTWTMVGRVATVYVHMLASCMHAFPSPEAQDSKGKRCDNWMLPINVWPLDGTLCENVCLLRIRQSQEI